MRTLPQLLLAVLVTCTQVQLTAQGAGPAVQQEPRPVFRSGVSRVTVAATVRDGRGRPVTNLTAADFDLFDSGERREILDFSRDQAPLGLAILVDVSGSMEVAAKRAAAIDTASHLLKSLTPKDEVGLYAFDRSWEELEPLRPAPGNVLEKLRGIDSYGRTSVFDAIADTSRRLVEKSGPRRAVVVLTDGDDNASRMTPGQVSAVASSIDVPVYVFVIISPLDRAGRSSVIEPHVTALQQGALGNLARWTGGEIFAPVAPDDVAAAALQIVNELRHQYLMAFEPGRQAGWHPLEVRARRPELTVRTRSGYVVPARTSERD